MTQKYKNGLVWLRRDLRLLDHRALSNATLNSQQVAVAFVFDTQILTKLSNKSDQRITFIYDTLSEINEKLMSHGSQLFVLYGNPIDEIPKLCRQLEINALFSNEDYESYALKRDKKVKALLEQQGIPSFFFKDQVIFSGGEVIKADGTPYQVFTPYKRTWLKQLKDENIKIQNVKNNFFKRSSSQPKFPLISLDQLGFQRAKFHYNFQLPGRKNAIKYLKAFSQSIVNYKENRDFPAYQGTSGLSVHLRFGTLSIRECVRLSLKSKSLGNETWLSELIWRDFYQMILVQFPHVETQTFKEKCKNLKWPGSEKMFQAWCKGQTGYPIVDAAMRQLQKTGWMHNRLRMIVASFLTKDLLVDWRKGEAYFAEKLLDFDLASNNGGWQWSASTGCDAQPYFRIFNPELQSQKFDPKGEFLKEWLPELQHCTPQKIHNPDLRDNYPQPIVDHKAQKVLAVQLFKALS